MLKLFEEVADNIRAIEAINNKMTSVLSIEDVEFVKLDKLYAERLDHINYIEKWINSESGKEIVKNHNKEWKLIFNRFMNNDKSNLNKIISLNTKHKSALKDLQLNKSILIYAREK